MDLTRFHKLDIVVICGLPGAGKSHFARTYFKETGRKRINRAEIRGFLFHMTTFGEPWDKSLYDEEDEHLVKHTERKIIENILHHNERVVVDNTSISTSSRKMYLEIARHTHKTIGVIFLDTPLRHCLERNRKRQDPIPENVLSELFARKKEPDISEGFRELLIVKSY